MKGRGAAHNPPNRFEEIHLEPGEDWNPDEEGTLKTQLFRDTTQTFITRNNSPDVGFETSINPYRGCCHGCIYCFARPTHEYLGFSAGLDFETRVLVKQDAPELLRKELAAPRYEPTPLSISGVTDCYQPVERTLKLTRRCLEVLVECRNPAALITKNHLITRDIDLLAELAKIDGVITILSVTTLDPELARVMEPRTSVPQRRLDAIRALSAAGVPVGVMVAPVVPGLTDHEMPRILEAAADAGACFAGFVPLRLPWAVAPLFVDWLGRHYPDRKEKVLNRIRDLRGGKLNDANFHTRMTGQGLWAEQFETMFNLATRRAGIDRPSPELSKEHFRVPGGQMGLFEK